MRPHLARVAGGAAAVLLLVAQGGPAAAGRGDLIRLQGDSDQAILIAQDVKDWLLTDLNSQRVFLHAKVLIVQHWVREKGAAGLTERERLLLRDPASYDRLIVQRVLVSMRGTGDRATAEALLVWDVALALWGALGADVSALMSGLAETMAADHARPVRVLVRFRDAEVLRVAAPPGGPATTIFRYR